MKLVRENLDILEPKSRDDILDQVKEMGIDEQLELAEEIYGGDWEEICLDISRYMGNWKFGEMLSELVIMKQEEQ